MKSFFNSAGKVWVLKSFAWFLLSFFENLSGSKAVEIRRLTVPRSVENGTNLPVILDCDYVYNENDIRLVVKWFFEDNTEPVYQWIPELGIRQISGILEGRLDTDFSVNSADAYSKFRALRILRTSTELSGKYTCLVASLAGQDSRNQVMIVYNSATKFDFTLSEQSNLVNVSCDAHGLFPVPVLKLYQRTSSTSQPVIMSDSTELYTQRTNGVYDIHAFRTFSASELNTRGASLFECTVEIPGTSYMQTKRLVYRPGHQGLQINASISTATYRKYPDVYILIVITIFLTLV